MDVSEFKLLYEKEGRFNLSVQVPYLSQLGDHYAAIGSKDPTHNWTSVLKVCSFGIFGVRNFGLGKSFDGNQLLKFKGSHYLQCKLKPGMSLALT